jgi:glutamine amidotransferase
MKVGLIDIGIGNIKSIENWLFRNNIRWVKLTKPVDLDIFDLVILPGVGSAAAFMNNLQSLGFIEKLENARLSGIRILGICLGAQVFLENLDEDGGIKGLNWIKGKVVKMDMNFSNTGWSDFSFETRDLSDIWRHNQKNINRKKRISGRVFYNHNFGMITNTPEHTICYIDKSNFDQYASIIHSNNILGFQFHPEKSQIMGNELLKLIL